MYANRYFRFPDDRVRTAGSFCRILFRQLRQDDGCEHDNTSDQLFCGKFLSQDHPACQYGDAGLQGKDQGGYRWIDIFLAHDLQSVGNAAGHDACIQDRKPGREDGRNLWMLQEQRQDRGKDATDQELDTGEFYAVCFRGKMVNDQNVQGKEDRTDQYQNIPEADRKTVCNAKKVKSHQSHNNGCPDKGTAFLSQEKSDDRDNHNVAGCDETGFSYRCVLNAELLEVAGSKEGNAAGNAAQPEVTAVIGGSGDSILSG